MTNSSATTALPIPTDAIAPSVSLITAYPAVWTHEKYNRLDPKADFRTWSRRLALFLSLLGLKNYVFSPIIPIPDSNSEPVARRNWTSNDDFARALVLTALDEFEQDEVEEFATAQGVYKAIEDKALGQGPIRQILLIKHAFDINFAIGSEPLQVTTKRIKDAARHIFSIRELTDDTFACCILLIALSRAPGLADILEQITRGLTKSTKENPYTFDHAALLLNTVHR